jgi:sialate O-acetylesterase
MQVHNHDAKQTLFALNHWREGQTADIGIGNQPTGNPDWTFAGNAGKWASKRLRVLVRCK